MLISISLESSESATKRTVAAQTAATRASPKIAEQIQKLTKQIRVLKATAFKNYKKRKAEDAKKATKAGKKPETTKFATPAAVPAVSSSFSISDNEDPLFLLSISDADLMECVSAAPIVQTAGESKKKARTLKQATKDPKVALRKKQMSAALRIRENKDIRVKIKKLLELKKKLRDTAWAAYLKKKKTSAAKPGAANPTDKTPNKNLFLSKLHAQQTTR